jgi:type I restriction-modification system DNA methylase subunit
VLERFKNVDLHPDRVDNPTMGTIFEELIRRFNEALNENPGEHFTPRDVVHLMVDLMLAGDEDRIGRHGVVRTVYDPCCGSGGMLMIAKEHITAGWRRDGEVRRPPINPDADIHLFGQEVNPETWAVSKSACCSRATSCRPEQSIVTNTKRRSRNAENQHRFRCRAIANGWVQCNVWVPEAALADLKLQGEVLRKYPHLSVGPLRDPVTGKYVPSKYRR